MSNDVKLHQFLISINETILAIHLWQNNTSVLIVYYTKKWLYEGKYVRISNK